MVEVEGSPCIYMITHLMSVLGDRGACGNTTRRRRASVVLHAGGLASMASKALRNTNGNCVPGYVYRFPDRY